MPVTNKAEAQTGTGGAQKQLEVKTVKCAQDRHNQPAHTSLRQNQDLHREVGDGQAGGGFHETRGRLPCRQRNDDGGGYLAG